MNYANPNVTVKHAPNSPIDPSVHAYELQFSSLIPSQYTDWVDESLSWKQTCYIGDWSFLLKLRIEGPDALAFLSSVAVNSFESFAIGAAKHMVCCNEDGKVIGEGILMRLGEQEFLFTSVPGVWWVKYQLENSDFDATATEITPADSRFIFQVQGPTSLFAVERATGADLRDLQFMRFREATIAGHELLVLRQGMSGDIGYELHGDGAAGIDVYNAILEAGAEFGIRRLGMRAYLINHIEACFPGPGSGYLSAWLGDGERDFRTAVIDRIAPNYVANIIAAGGSYDLSDPTVLYRSPYELGWGRSVKFDHEFIGREALEREADNQVAAIVTLIWNPEDLLDVYASLFEEGEDPYQVIELPRPLVRGFPTHEVRNADGVLVGASRARCYSHHFRKMMSLCTIEIGHSEPGTEVTILWGDRGKRQKEIRATVAPAPYKVDQRRADVTALTPG